MSSDHFEADLNPALTRLSAPVNWLLPAWAALCGALAGGVTAQPDDDWLRLALTLLLVNVGWGALWTALGSVDWAAAFRLWREWTGGAPLPSPPYTRPGMPADRAARWLGELRAWWTSAVWPGYAPVLTAAALALITTAALSALLGPQMLLLSAAALAMMQLGVTWESGRGSESPLWDASIAVALSWLAGHAAAGAPTLRSAGLAALFALACGAAGRADSRWGRTLGIAAQLAAAAAIVSLRHPLAATGLWLLLIPQMALLPWMRRGQSSAWYARHTRLWLAAAMLVAAWAVRGVRA